MPQSYLLGVDGGGTKTDFVLVDRAGVVVAAHQEASAYYLQIGIEGLRQLLARGLEAVLAEAGVRGDDVEHVFVGLPAYGEDSALEPALDALPEQLLGHRRYRCGNDMLCTWAGSLGGADGIGIVAGTGSIGYGERGGRTARVGGWGELFGDEGSAYWISIRGLNTFSRMADGRLPRGALYDVFGQAFGLRSDLDLLARALGPDGAARDRIAALCPLVASAADAGDVQAQAIFDDAAAEIARMAAALRVALRYEPGERVPVSYAGGVFKTGERVLTPLRRCLSALSSDFELRAPLLAPSIGAALYAARDCGRPLGAEAIERLRRWRAPRS
jgi:N-acetylglucosamine kinase-like BadF-type ATPase